MDYKSIFDDYIKSVYGIREDIRFWSDFLNMSIRNYKNMNPTNRWISESGIFLYNITNDGRGYNLYSHPETFTIEIDDLDVRSNEFFTWVTNLSLVRMYNAVEVLLLRLINLEFFSHLPDPIAGKAEVNKTRRAITEYFQNNGLKPDRTNDRFIIKFLKLKSSDFKKFCEASVNYQSWNTSWENFFELLAVLRHIVAHQGMVVSRRNINQIKSIAADIFLYYFEQQRHRLAMKY